MATDQEVLKARTFRFAKSPGDSEDSAADADWYRSKMRTVLNAHRYIHGSLQLVWLFPSRGQDFLEYLTPWEREWSVLARSYVGGFTPIVDENGTVIGHQGVTGTTEITPLIASYEDLLYTLPEQTYTQIRVDPTNFGRNVDWHITGKDLLQLLKDDASVFVHNRAKTPPPDWRRLHYIPAETKLILTVSIDGQLFDFVPAMTGFLKEGYSPVDVLAVGRVLGTLGAKIGTRIIRSLVRKTVLKGEAQLVLRGPTVEMAKKARARMFEKPTITGATTLKAGEGFTTKFGDVTYSTLGSADEVALARFHESVHSFLSPKLKVLRTMRADFGAAAYERSSLVKYIEEALAETYAQLRVKGGVGAQIPSGWSKQLGNPLTEKLS